MKYSIAFGFALALLLGVAVSASADDGTMGPVERFDTLGADVHQPAAGRQVVEDVLDSLRNLMPDVAYDRPWCPDDCAARQGQWKYRDGNPAEGCARWKGWYTRCLIKQRAWPSCACVYTDWHLEGTEICVESVPVD